MQKKSLEISCYVLGAGAFSLLSRWMQHQLAFDENGLVGPSFWNGVVVIMILVSAWLFRRFTSDFKKDGFYVPDETDAALANDGRIYSAVRIAIGGLMMLGALILLMQSENEKAEGFIRVVAGLGVLSGASFIYLTSSIGKTGRRGGLICLASAVPIALFAFWLITFYKMNDNNSAVWAFAIQIIACCTGLWAFFRIAGFAFSAAEPWKAMRWCMLGCVLCMMTLVDESYFGMSVMMAAAASMLLYYNWVLIKNMLRREKKPKPVRNDGFERLR